MIWVFIAACVAAVGLIAYGLATRKDRKGLGQIRKWDPSRLPVTLVPEPGLDIRVRGALKWAIQFWAGGVPGLRLFNPLGNLTLEGTIVPVSMSDDLPERAAAVTRLTFDTDGAVLSAAVYVGEDAADRMQNTELLRAVAHELGHVLGLAHDDFGDSIMYRKALSSEARVTEADVAFLLDVYGVPSQGKVV